MFTAFLFTVVFCFYCCVYNGIHGNRVAATAGTKSNKNQGLKLVSVVPENFTQLSSPNQEEGSVEPLNKITDSIVGVSETKTSPNISDPWTLPIVEDIAATTLNHHTTHSTCKPLLLLPPAASIVIDEHDGLISSSLKLDELLTKVDLDKLQLRPARKIAKELGIAQKVNNKDQPLSFLLGQIKSKLQQWQLLPPKTVEIVRELLAS